MWENLTKQHQRSLTSLHGGGAKDLLLVGDCGGRVGTHRLLLALRSPLVADLLLDVGDVGAAISLPFPLSSISALADAMQGRQGDGKNQEFQDVADCLGFVLNSEERFKMESLSDVDQPDDDFWESATNGDVKHEENEHKEYLSRTKLCENIKEKQNIERDYDDGGSSDLSSGDEDNDPNFVKDIPSPAKASTDHNISKRGRGRPRKGAKIKKELPCDHCDRQFKNPRLLLKHRLEKHEISISCDSCENQYTQWEDYKKHLGEAHPSHTCDICGVKKFTATALAIHIESKHQDDLPCPQCGLMFATKTSLNHHIGKSHGEYKIIQCEKCEFTTRVASIMRAHFKRKHVADMKKTCEVCGETFKELHLHLSRTACGKSEKTFHCDQCDKTFFTRPSLKQHIKRVHNTIRVKDKFCPECSYSTYSNYNLKLHMTSVHQGNILVKQACPHCDKVCKSLNYHLSVYHPEKRDSPTNFLEQNKDIFIT